MLAHCDLTVYLMVRDSAELTAIMVVAQTFTWWIIRAYTVFKAQDWLVISPDIVPMQREKWG